MRIILIGNKYGAVNSDAEEGQIVKDFETLGNHTQFINREHWKYEVDQLPTDNWDLIFIANYAYIDEREIEYLKDRFKCKTVYWSPDMCTDIKSILVPKAAHVDAFLSKQLEFKADYEKHGVNFVYWPYDVAMDIFQKEPNIDVHNKIYYKKYLPKPIPVGITFNWVHDPWRMKTVWEIQQKFPDLYIASVSGRELKNGQISTGDPKTSPSCSQWGLNHVMAQMFGNQFNVWVGQTSINLSLEWKISEGYWSNRIARYMCAGGFVLSYYTKGMENTFKDYIEYFTTVDECVEKIHYWLAHDKERKEKAERGYQYANENLRGINRVRELMTYLEDGTI